KINNLAPNGRVRKIRRMNAESNKRIIFDDPAYDPVPGEACCASPTVSNTVNERTRREYFTGSQIAHCSKSGGVFHLCITRRSLRFAAQQPRRRDKSARL